MTTSSTSSASALSTSVARTSSASYPDTSITGVRNAANNRRTNGSWRTRSSGIAVRVAL